MNAPIKELELVSVTKRYGGTIAVDAINSPRDFVQSKQLIAERCELAAEQLADSETQLKDLAA